MTCWLLQVLRDSGNPSFMQLCQPWVRMLLGGGSLTALSTHLRTIPRPPILQHLPLRHLEVVVSSRIEWLEGFSDDVSSCGSLESLRIGRDASKPANALIGAFMMRLPSMYLHGMPRLKHVRLDNCLPGHDLALPADCSLFLDGLCFDDSGWQEHLGKIQHHVAILQLFSSDRPLWPLGIQSFPHVQYLELEIPWVWGGALTTLRHIPHVRVILGLDSELKFTTGSWETLEVFCFGELRVSIGDMHSFVRDTKDFTFMSESPPPHGHKHVVGFGHALLKQGRACHVCRHIVEHRRGLRSGGAYDKRITYAILSTNEEMAKNYPVTYYQDNGPKVSFGRGKTLADWQDFWPCDPCESVKRT